MSGLTEEEARTKWCPDSRVFSPKQGGSNRCEGWDNPAGAFHERAHIYTGSRCLASDCVAWRTLPNGKGYCGRAGEPFAAEQEQLEDTLTSLFGK